MNDEGGAPCRGDRPGEVAKPRIAVEIVDPDAGLDRDRYRCRLPHGGDALGDEGGLRHEGGPEAPLQHARARAAHVEVDLVVSRPLGEARAPGEVRGIVASQLDRHRVLGRIEAKRPLRVAVEQGAGRDHLRIEPRAAAEETQQVAGMPVRAPHHGGDAEPVRGEGCAHARDHSGNGREAAPGPRWDPWSGRPAGETFGRPLLADFRLAC